MLFKQGEAGKGGLAMSASLHELPQPCLTQEASLPMTLTAGPGRLGLGKWVGQGGYATQG